ncbi:DNA replication/repair protein RecF [Magnetovibrio sp.]|uniref:DNA replication/repair protein RecF n=1 Tax=Magnetovibrio sp. TaxID=2024836 RepID=UPI002F923E47
MIATYGLNRQPQQDERADVTQSQASVAFNGPDLRGNDLSRNTSSCDDGAAVPDAAVNDVGRLACARLTLSNFRCYEHLRLEPGLNPVVLTGANGAGKTNILEALSFLVPGSGLRRARLSDVGRRDLGADQGRAWAVAADIKGGAFPVSVGTGIETAAKTAAAAKRVVHVDGAPQRALSVLSEHFAAQWLTPQMDRLFLDGSQERRRFLDRLVFGFDPAHAGRINAYNHALRERSRLLADGKNDDAWLSALEDTMATRGMAVAAARLGVAERLAGACAHMNGPFPASTLAIDGLAEGWLMDHPALAVEDRLRAALKRSRAADAAHGGAGNGLDGRLPHQSDLLVTHAAKAMPAGQCSTGEQKMLLVGLVLAAARLSASDEGRTPVLLLDEVAAHLDVRHRDALFDEVLTLGCQAWFTGTDAELFAPLSGKAKFYSIDDAKLAEGH